MQIKRSWTELKALVISKSGSLQYEDQIEQYKVWMADALDEYMTYIEITDPRNIDQIDFEDNYKANANKPIHPKDVEGKDYVRAESRPLNCTTCFTTCGDDVSSSMAPQIGAGDRLEWDASDSEQFSTEGAPDGMKQKVIEIQFCDSIWLKEGTLYWVDCSKGSYADMEVLCPPGLYFMYQGQVYQNTTGDWLVVDHYLFKSPMCQSVPMGDELNTETCSQELPSYLKFRMTITLPVADVISYGYMQLEIYRVRTVVLSGL